MSICLWFPAACLCSTLMEGRRKWRVQERNGVSLLSCAAGQSWRTVKPEVQTKLRERLHVNPRPKARLSQRLNIYIGSLTRGESWDNWSLQRNEHVHPEGETVYFGVLLFNVIKVKEMGVSLANAFNIVYCQPAPKCRDWVNQLCCMLYKLLSVDSGVAVTRC